MRSGGSGADDPEATDLASTATAGAAAAPAGTIGRYRLLQKIGEGGMGEVWLAEQAEPVRRRVALKIIKRGMDSQQVVARFEAERQALALMDHPCVAKVFDAGTTAEGRPYFVMEYVAGVPITDHCDGQRLTIRERLELFLAVCDGVHHAHQKAIIHRDLKPSNVLVSLQDGKAAPKIIDFGVAKATAQRLTEKTLFTEVGLLIGTPEYMSPEQADLTGQDVDTRTDVYALGVMLYELLVGARPFESKELRNAGIDGIRRLIREVEPPRPSTRLNTIGAERCTDSARRRRVDVSALRRELAGDLDWMAMKALEKDRTRRYGSAAELAADIGHHLRHEPVVARPPSAGYRASKFVRRHRVGVAFTACGVVVLIGFAALMTLQAARIAREARAKGQVIEFLTDLFEVSDPSEARGNAITARELLDRGAEKIRGTLTDAPEVRAELMATMGTVYGNLGLNTQAESLQRETLEARRRLLGPDDPHTIASISDLATTYVMQGRFQDAEASFREALEAQKRVLGPAHPGTLSSMHGLANAYWYQKRYAEAEALYRETAELRKQVLGPVHKDTLRSLHNVANAQQMQGHYKEAEAVFRETLEIQRRLLGSDHPDLPKAMNNLGVVLSKQGRHAESEAVHREALEIQRRVLGPEHQGTLLSMHNVANQLHKQGRDEEAGELGRETAEIQRRVLGPDHPDTLSSMDNLALIYCHLQRYAEAEALDRERLEIQTRVLGPDHPDTRETLYSLACDAALQGRRQDALRELHEAATRGYENVDQITTDADVASLRGDPEFEKIVAVVKQNRERLVAAK